MKKIVFAIVALTVIASVSFAQPTKSSRSNIGFGVDATQAMPYMRLMLNDNMGLDFGLSYSSEQRPGGGGTTVTNTAFTGMVRFESKLGKIANNLYPLWGIGVMYTSFSGGASAMSLVGLVGAEYFISDNFSVYGNINLLTYNSNNDGTRTLNDMYVITGNFLSYSGLRVYL